MKHGADILEIPVDKTKNVKELVKWFELNKVHQKKHPHLALSVKNEFPAIVTLGFIVLVGIALIRLEEKKKLKIKASAVKISSEDFLDLIKNSTTENEAETLIEARYDLDLIIQTPRYDYIHHPVSIVAEPTVQYGLNDAFGIFKDKKDSLSKIRDEQWGKRK